MTTTQNALIELDKIVKLFSSQELVNTISTVFIQTAGKPSDSWSLGNKILMVLAGTTDARTFNAWNQVNRHVKKGSKAFYILRPVYTLITETDKETGKVKLDETGKPKQYQILTGFKAQPEFRFEDTEGQPLQEYKPKEIPPLMDVAKKWNMTVVYDNSREGEQGSFNPDSNKIRLCVEDPAVFFHELAHKAHSKIEKLKLGQDQEQETIAELSAATLSQLYGYNTAAKSFEYIASYAGSHTPEAVGKMCLKVLDKVQKVLALILGAANGEAEDTIKESEPTKEPATAPAPVVMMRKPAPAPVQNLTEFGLNSESYGTKAKQKEDTEIKPGNLNQYVEAARVKDLKTIFSESSGAGQ